jgi:antitoxin component YwqK of YwqJK toxin-antitoxin module
LENGKITGAKVFYYKDGSVYREENYVNDLLDGWVKIYGTTGKLVREEYYSSGNLQRSRDYDLNGNLISSRSY